MHAFELNWSLSRSARRGAETEFSIKVVYSGGDLTCPARESIFRARNGDNSLSVTDSIWNTSFSYGSRFLNGGPSFLCTL